jgi:hypothetical protein
MLNAVDRYVRDLVNAGLRGKSKEAVFEKVREIFYKKMLACPDAVIKQKKKDLFDQAVEAFLKEKDSHGPDSMVKAQDQR